MSYIGIVITIDNINMSICFRDNSLMVLIMWIFYSCRILMIRNKNQGITCIKWYNMKLFWIFKPNNVWMCTRVQLHQKIWHEREDKTVFFSCWAKLTHCHVLLLAVMLIFSVCLNNNDVFIISAVSMHVIWFSTLFKCYWSKEFILGHKVRIL